jgi:MFS family permease
MAEARRPWWILPTIVVGQVLVTSTWFAANAVIRDLQAYWADSIGTGAVTIAVQLGFIAGTLVYAVLGLADRFAPRHVFLASGLLAASCNAAVLAAPEWVSAVIGWRFLAGFWLAGVYPVGMKIAASWYAEGLSRALGYLVGALVLGTALPHLVRALHLGSDWRYVLIGSSAAAVVGSLLVGCVPAGPHLRPGGNIRFGDVLAAFAESRFRNAVFGYFGHMWELYAFWAFVPFWIKACGFADDRVSVISFAVIAMGAVGCVVGGQAALRWGSARVARWNLFISGACCVLSPLLIALPHELTLPLLLIWGFTVVADSPQLSTLNAQLAPRHVVGSALTFSTCIGFGITIASITLLERLTPLVDPRYLFLPLAVGPIVGVWRLGRLAP